MEVQNNIKTNPYSRENSHVFVRNARSLTLTLKSLLSKSPKRKKNTTVRLFYKIINKICQEIQPEVKLSTWTCTPAKKKNKDINDAKFTYQIKSLQWLQNVGCLKNLGTNLWFFTSKTFFCLKAPRLCTPFDTPSSPLSAILTESSSVSDCLRSLDAGPRTTSNKCYFFMHEWVSKNGKATHAVSTWHLAYARIQTLLYIFSLFVDLIEVLFSLY